MAKGSCRCKHQECEECPEWIFTFADLVMLMMGFFVILWVLKPSPNDNPKQQMDEEWIKVAAAIREAFNYLPDPNSKDPVDMHMLLKKLQDMQPPKGPGDGGKTKLEKKGIDGTEPEVQTIRPGKESAVGGRLLFDAGEARLTPEVARAVDQIAKAIRGHRNIVLVKGHASADDLGDGATAQQRMDLSLRRAQAVADLLTSKGVEPEILRVQGCSTFEPVVERAYRSDIQAMNRRVEVEATASLVEDRQDPRKTAARPLGATTGLAATTPAVPAEPAAAAGLAPASSPAARAE